MHAHSRRKRILRLSRGAGFVATGATAAVVLASSPALAATSQTAVYHRSGAVAGKVWFNSGTHNPAKGRNSFTVKDSMCGDGWAIFAKYQIGSGPVRWTDAISCGEFSVSVAGNVARTRITWSGCKLSPGDENEECEPSKSDWVD